ncbi:hypothetical protein BH09MYX1_BH09MYX1_15730 [soil metagenome]
MKPIVREAAAALLGLSLVLGATLACKGSSSSSPPSGPVEPASALSSTKKDYAGHWEGGGVTLDISASAVNYEKKVGNTSTVLSGTLDHFEGDDVVIKILIPTSTLKVSSPPTLVGGTWTMTVEGVEVTRK